MELPAGYREIDDIIRDHEQNPRRAAALDRARGRLAKRNGLDLSHRVRIYLFHNGITVDQLMLVILCSALLIFGMLVSRDLRTEEPDRFYKPTRITESLGWTCIRRADGKDLCLSEAAMQEVDDFRTDVRYLPRG